MQQLLDSNPDVLAYAALVSKFLWSTLAPSLLMICVISVLPKIVYGVFRGLE